MIPEKEQTTEWNRIHNPERHSAAAKSLQSILLISSTCGCTIPQPKISIQPSPLQKRQPTRLRQEQEHWSGLPFPFPMRESEVAQSCPTQKTL